MSKTIILHMGAHKTGSSSLQDTLLANNEILEQFGIHYLDMKDNTANHVLNFIPIVDVHEKSFVFNIKKIGELGVDVEKFKKNCHYRFIMDYDNFLKNDKLDYFIISAEGFEYFTKEDFAYTKEFLLKISKGTDINIKPVIYIREAKNYFISQFQEMVKESFVIDNETVQYNLNKLYNYDVLISDLEEVFGETNVNVLKYDIKDLHCNCIIQDFIYKVFNKENVLISDTNKNISLGLKETVLRSEYFRNYDENMLKLSAFDEYESLKKLDNEKFNFKLLFNEEQAKRINNSITKINNYLTYEQKFDFVTPSNDMQIYPNFNLLDTEYLQKIIEIVDNQIIINENSADEIYKEQLIEFKENMQLFYDRRVKNTKRVAIYFFFDKDGIVSDYVYKFLSGVLSNVDRLVVVVNGKLTSEGRRGLERYTKDLIVRENVGLDVWAYKTAIEYLGWDYLKNAYELLLINSTLYGPIYSFDKMFVEMDTREIDFWGITKHHQTDGFYHKTKYGYVPEHIQSSFIAIRNKMLNSIEYRALWDNMPMINSYTESVGIYEGVFTKDFEDKGYISDVYINTEDLREFTIYPLLLMSDELIINRKCPVMKRKSFNEPFQTFMGSTLGIQTLKTFNYLKEETKYNTDLIMEDVIRCFNLHDIKSTMHLDYTLPLHSSTGELKEFKKIALCMHIYFEDLIEYCYNYAKNMPRDSDLFITSDSAEKLEAIKLVFDELLEHFGRIEYIKIENRGRDVSALLVGCKDYIMDYDYVCFAHDKKTAQVKPLSMGVGFSEKCFDNTLGSKDYILNVIDLFEKEKYLGVLSPHYPIHGEYNHIIGYEWTTNFEVTKNLLIDKMKLNVNLDPAKPPIAPLGTMFWFRPQALKALFDMDWKYTDFPPEPNNYDGTLLHAIERAYGIVPQHEGYYSAYVLNDEMRRATVTNMEYLFNYYKTMLWLNNQNIPMNGVLTKREKARNVVKGVMPPFIFRGIVDIKRALIGPKDLKGNY